MGHEEVRGQLVIRHGCGKFSFTTKGECRRQDVEAKEAWSLGLV